MTEQDALAIVAILIHLGFFAALLALAVGSMIDSAQDRRRSQGRRAEWSRRDLLDRLRVALAANPSRAA